MYANTFMKAFWYRHVTLISSSATLFRDCSLSCDRTLTTNASLGGAVDIHQLTQIQNDVAIERLCVYYSFLISDGVT